MSKSFKVDLKGQRFGRLTVIEFVPNSKNTSYWKCRCDCGKIATVVGANLKNGTTKSCGCFVAENARELFRKHSRTGTRLYRIWQRMKQRCYDFNSINYDNYGGRDISVCPEWIDDFVAFRDWAMSHGYADNLSIDRIDNDKGYFPENCRWADRKTQCRNRRSNVIVEYQGEMITLVEVAEKIGMDARVLQNRYRRGDRGERLFRPVK